MFAILATACLVLSQDQESKSEPARKQMQDADKKSSHPLSKKERLRIASDVKKTIDETTNAIEEDKDNSRAISTRADAMFFGGRFKASVKDYDRMVELDRRLDASHWRRGIAYFYAGQLEKAAGQFERYHSFDNVDRENGIWRYLCQHRAKGRDYARKGLLKYRKDDREPFPAVYKLFAGKIAPDEILKQIKAAKISPTEREKRIFYAELYIGLNEFVEGRKKSAEQHLSIAVATKWPRTAGFGPNYMWHVGRVQLDLLMKSEKRGEAAKSEGGKQAP